LEADRGARCRAEARSKEDWTQVDDDDCIGHAFTAINVILVLAYTAEVCVRIYTYRRAFLNSLWNILDVTIVVTGLIDVILDFCVPRGPQRLMLKLFRVMRLFRAIRLLTIFPELYRFVELFTGALKALFWGFLLILFMILFWSVVSVEFINPRLGQVHFGDADDSCQRSFSTVWHTMLFFFQTLVVGDDWGTCINPMVVNMPASLIVFVLAVVTVQLGFMNLILSAIVDSAAAAREHDHQQRAAEKQRMERGRLEKLQSIYEHIDHNKDGHITLMELIDSFESEPDVRTYLQGMNINTDDLSTIFDLMDVDRSGDLSYEEFVSTFAKAQSQDARIHMMTVKLQGTQILREVREQAQSILTLAKQVVAAGQEVKKLGKSEKRDEHKREGFHAGDEASSAVLTPRSSLPMSSPRSAPKDVQAVPLSSPRSSLKDLQAAPPKAGAPSSTDAASLTVPDPEPVAEKLQPRAEERGAATNVPGTRLAPARAASREMLAEETGVATKVPGTSSSCQPAGPSVTMGRCEANPSQSLTGWRAALTPRAVSRLPRLLREEEREPPLQYNVRPQKSHTQSRLKLGNCGSHFFEKFTEDRCDRGVDAAAKGSVEGRFESAVPVWTASDQRSSMLLQTGEAISLEGQLRQVTASLTEGLADIMWVVAKHKEFIESSLDTRRTEASTACPSDEQTPRVTIGQRPGQHRSCMLHSCV
jgi:voltage-gated sodium channel